MAPPPNGTPNRNTIKTAPPNSTTSESHPRSAPAPNGTPERHPQTAFNGPTSLVCELRRAVLCVCFVAHPRDGFGAPALCEAGAAGGSRFPRDATPADVPQVVAHPSASDGPLSASNKGNRHAWSNFFNVLFNLAPTHSNSQLLK